MQRYFKCLYAHGISLSSSRPPWSPIPPAARRTPEPASRSLPSPFDQVSPGDADDNEQLLTEDQLSQNIFTHSITARQDMDVFRIDLMKMFLLVGETWRKPTRSKCQDNFLSAPRKTRLQLNNPTWKRCAK